MFGRPNRLVIDKCLKYTPKTPNAVMDQKKDIKENYLPVKLMAAFNMEPIPLLSKAYFGPIGVQYA